MNDTSHSDTCLVCHRDANQTPLVALEYRGLSLRICPQHLPVLIHDPSKLIGKLPGAEDLKPADHHDQSVEQLELEVVALG